LSSTSSTSSSRSSSSSGSGQQQQQQHEQHEQQEQTRQTAQGVKNEARALVSEIIALVRQKNNNNNSSSSSHNNTSSETLNASSPSLAEQQHNNDSINSNSTKPEQQQQQQQQQLVEARANTKAKAALTASQEPEQVLRALTAYTQASMVTKQPGEAGGADAAAAGETFEATLRYAHNQQFVPVRSHFFSCCDNRATYGVLGTPGGDVAEFIMALGAADTLRRQHNGGGGAGGGGAGGGYSLEEVNILFQDFLRLMPSLGRKYFYMHTDRAAVNAMKTALNVANPVEPYSAAERNRILAAAAKPEFIGCAHLSALVAPDALTTYGIRPFIAQAVIRCFLNVLFDEDNPLRRALLYVVLEGGAAQPSAGVRVASPNACPGVAPLIVPNSGEQQLHVYHDKHVRFFRQDLARFFAFKHSADLPSVDALYAATERLAARALPKLASTFGEPVYDAEFLQTAAQEPY
jgi:hypothetical protein